MLHSFDVGSNAHVPRCLRTLWFADARLRQVPARRRYVLPQSATAQQELLGGESSVSTFPAAVRQFGYLPGVVFPQVKLEGRTQFLSAVCMTCLEGWGAGRRLRCLYCATPWDGSSLVIGTMYSYDIFAAMPCCTERLRVSCEGPAADG